MYKMTEREKKNVSFELADILRNIPLEEVDEIISNAQKIAENCANSKDEKDRYWYAKKLINEVEILLEENNIQKIFSLWLFEHNHGHSGWTSDINRIYCSPRNNEERVLSKRLWEILLETTKRFTESVKPTTDFWGFMDIGKITKCIYRLGENVPNDLVLSLKKFINDHLDCIEKDSPHSHYHHASQLKLQIDNDFPIHISGK